MYGRVTQVDLANGQVSVTWSIYAYTGTDNSSLFKPGQFDPDVGFFQGYPDFPIGELSSPSMSGVSRPALTNLRCPLQTST